MQLGFTMFRYFYVLTDCSKNTWGYSSFVFLILSLYIATGSFSDIKTGSIKHCGIFSIHFPARWDAEKSHRMLFCRHLLEQCLTVCVLHLFLATTQRRHPGSIPDAWKNLRNPWRNVKMMVWICGWVFVRFSCANISFIVTCTHNAHLQVFFFVVLCIHKLLVL